jgi:hypothetical protein
MSFSVTFQVLIKLIGRVPGERQSFNFLRLQRVLQWKHGMDRHCCYCTRVADTLGSLTVSFQTTNASMRGRNLWERNIGTTLGLGGAFSLLPYNQSARLLERGIIPSQDIYLHTGQNKEKKSRHRHAASSWIRTHDPSIWENEYSIWLRLQLLKVNMLSIRELAL